MSYPNLDNDPELSKKDDEIKVLKYRTKKHDHEIIWKSLKKLMENIKRKNGKV